MTLTVRLDPQLEDQLEDYCRTEGATKSAVVTQALREFLSTLRQQRTPYEVYREVAQENGLDELAVGEPSDNSLHYKQRLKAKLNAKHGR
ncbi:MAG TPA: hypothetical protein VI279_11050 [Rhodocyclaceae bacterium]|jgi:predicted transcriptional regulator